MVELLHTSLLVKATRALADVEQGGALLPVLARRDATIDDAMIDVFPQAERMALSASNDAGWAAGAAAAELADLSVGQELPGR